MSNELSGLCLHKALKRMRTERGLTQIRLAKEIGVSTFTLIRWERGERTPDGVYLEKISRALGYWVVLDTDGMWNCFPIEAAKKKKKGAEPPSPEELYRQALEAKDKSVWNSFFQRLTEGNLEFEAWLRSSDGGASLDESTINAVSRVIMALVQDRK